MIERERFVSRPVADVIRQLKSTTLAGNDDLGHDDRDAARWTSMCRLVATLYHHEFHAVERRTTEAWRNIGDDPTAAEEITGDLTGLLDSANYTPLTTAELDDAMEEEALIPQRLVVDFDLYDELLIYRRGSRTETAEHPRFLRSAETIEITVDDHVVVHTRIKPSE